MKLFVFVLASFFISNFLAQKIKETIVEYHYIQLPLSPLPEEIKNYQSFVIADYEKDNKKKSEAYEKELAEAQAVFDKEEAEYPNKVKEAELKYEKEMAEWKEKSLAEKVVEKRVLHENNKPVLRLPNKPYKKSVKEPKLQRSYDYSALASTYLFVDGLKNSAPNAVNVEVILYGFDYTNPRQVTEQKKIVSSGGGSTSSRNVNYYHVEFTYRHTMSIKVTDPTGMELFYKTPQKLNNYKKYKSGESTTAVRINQEQLLATYEEQILQENLAFINSLVNDEIGFKKQPRTVSLSYVKEKKGIYTDLLVAFNDATAGLKLLIDDQTNAFTKLKSAITNYEKALLESNMNDKKARIDKGVSLAIYFNILECYIAVGDLDKADNIIVTLNTLPISGIQRKRKEDYELLISDFKLRLKANK